MWEALKKFFARIFYGNYDNMKVLVFTIPAKKIRTGKIKCSHAGCSNDADLEFKTRDNDLYYSCVSCWVSINEKIKLPENCRIIHQMPLFGYDSLIEELNIRGPER